MDRDKGKQKALNPLEGTNIFRFKRKKMENTSGQDAAEAAGGKKETEAKEDTDDDFQEILLEGTETEYSTEETVLSTSEELDVRGKEVPVVDSSEEEETILSPKESSTKNPKGIKKKNVVEQAAENNPTGMKNEQVSEEEEMVLISDEEKNLSDTLSDACTGKLPTSPIDKVMDSDKDKSMRSPPGDL